MPSSTIELNQREFEIDEVHPLVVELKPTDQQPVPLYEWVSLDPHAVAKAARNCRILRVRNAVAKSGISSKPACRKGHSVEIFHADGRDGEILTNIWTTGGQARQPTAFAQSTDVANAMKECRESLVSFNGVPGDLQDFYEELSKPADQIPVQQLHKLFVSIPRSFFVRKNRTLIQKILNPFGSDYEERSVTLHSELLLFQFNEAVTKTLRGQIYLHDWSITGNSALIADNSDHQKSGLSRPALLHRRMLSEPMEQEADLYRLQILDCFKASGLGVTLPFEKRPLKLIS